MLPIHLAPLSIAGIPHLHKQGSRWLYSLQPLIAHNTVPNPIEPCFEATLELLTLGVDLFVITRQLLEPQQPSHGLHPILPRRLFVLDLFHEVFPLGQVHQVGYHFCELGGHVALLVGAVYYVGEYLIRSFRQCAFLKFQKVQLLEIPLYTFIELVDFFEWHIDIEALEHIEYLLTGQPTRTVRIELCEDSLDLPLADQLLRRKQVVRIASFGIVEATAQPLYDWEAIHRRSLGSSFHTNIRLWKKTYGQLGITVLR